MCRLAGHCGPSWGRTWLLARYLVTFENGISLFYCFDFSLWGFIICLISSFWVQTAGFLPLRQPPPVQHDGLGGFGVTALGLTAALHLLACWPGRHGSHASASCLAPAAWPGFIKGDAENHSVWEVLWSVPIMNQATLR